MPVPFIPIRPAQRPDPCTGGEWSENGERCCPFDTWTNATFAAVTDASTMLWLNEARSRKVLRELFERSHPDADDEAGILELAQSVRAPQGLGMAMVVGQGQRALANFNALFPDSRWRMVSAAKPSRCNPSGHDLWRASSRWTEPQVRTLETLSGMTLSGPQRAALANGQGWAPGTPKHVIQWLIDTWALLHKVPKGAPHEQVKDWPTARDAIVLVEPDDPFDGQGRIEAGPWLREVLERFGPPKRVVLPTGGTKPMTLGERIAQATKTTRLPGSGTGLPTGKRRPELNPDVGDALGDALGGGGGLPSPAPGNDREPDDGIDDTPALPQPDLDTPSYFQLQRAGGEHAGWLHLGRGEARLMAAALDASPEGLSVREASGEPVL